MQCAICLLHSTFSPSLISCERRTNVDAQEVCADQTGSNLLPKCDEAHYPRILRGHPVLPGPERQLGAYRCPKCNAYFDEKFNPVTLPAK